LQQIMADDDQHMIEHFSHLPNPPPTRSCQISAMNALLEGFAYTWLVVNPANGQTITTTRRSTPSPTSSPRIAGKSRRTLGEGPRCAQ
jgi:hypothetical protein